MERGAKRGGRRAPEKLKSGGGNVKILLPGTKAQGIAGRGEQRGAAARGPGRLKFGGGNVKILLPETKAQGIAGSGEQRGAAAGGPRSSNPAAEM